VAATTPVWRAFEANEITHSGAHYLLAVAASAETGRPPRSADVARALGVTRAAASMQLRTLQEHGLVAVDRDQRLHLTATGADLVARVASKREVVRTFLNEVLGVRPATAELDACKVEHLLSEESGAALVRLLRFLRSAPDCSGVQVSVGRPVFARRARYELCGGLSARCQPST
jgi:Mn-dependent DtxR family transcriptional regulator